ncbi:MAG TPA: methyl-accepting chemotaxis protein [Noviherbaspirillum sp.]|nr:methyl-accepting chemotaxis protein [Noviherbaspirillum sp.]
MSITRLLDRLLLWQKFVILSVIALILTGIPTYLYMREANQAMDAAVLETDGLEPVSTILRTVQLTQQHRGLSALVLGGVESARAQREAKQQEADQSYERMAAIVAALNDSAIKNAWNAAYRDWQALRAAVAGGSISVDQSYAAHSELVPKLLAVNELIGDYFGLSLDPSRDSYQLIQAVFYIQPFLTEELGRMRAKGAGLLAKKSASEDDRMKEAELVARAQDRMQQMMTAFNKAMNANPALKGKLAGGMQEAVALATQTMQLATDKIVKAEQLDYPSVDYVAFATRAIDAQFKAHEAASRELAIMLNAKVAGHRALKWSMAVAMLALIAIAALAARLIARSVSVPLSNAVSISQRIATGDLTSRFDTSSTNETGQLLRALADMNGSLANIVASVRSSVDHINAGANDIASGNADLSARTESQASSLEETASSMEEMTSTVKQNAANASQANQLVCGTSEVALRGGEIVAQVVQTMGAINDSSRRIADIIGVIDGIAFQTNILALNAAVEAARAGEQGRGFAVVASEVRSLARRSADAAREIRDLIGDSVEKVDAGNKLADEAGHAMEEIVRSVKRVTGIMSEITTASSEQSAGIEQISNAVTQMDEMTQQNAALVEQAAAAAASLKDQSQQLVQSVSVFRVASNS